MSNISSTCRFPKYSKGAHYVWSLAQWRVTNLCCLYHPLASTGKTVITTPARATGTDRWNFLRHENNLFVQCIPFSVASVINVCSMHLTYVLHFAVYLKMLIHFRDHFFDMPNRQRVKARRNLGFGFCMITSDLNVPASKVDSAVKTII